MNYEVKDNECIIKLDGRLDTTRSQEIGSELIQIADESLAGKIVIDASDLEYISSSGLRVMMRIAKLGKDFSVINVSPEVYEIFSVTGFIDVMTVKKKLRKISIDGLELIRRDEDGIVYELPDDKVLKVYNKYVDEEHVDRDKSTVKKLLLEGMPVMIAFETVETEDGQTGVIFIK